jgi:uncharacterized GH25 family protein
MKRSGTLMRIIGLNVPLMLLLLAVPAHAHFLWINVADYSLMEKEKVTMNFGWGHSFGNPVGNVLRDMDRLDELVLLGPNGDALKMASQNEIEFKGKKPLNQAGTYMIAAKRKEGFFSKTTEGYKRQSKKGLKNVLQCSYSGGYAKAIINVGEEGGGTIVSKPLGHTLEIVPLKDPADLRVGDDLPVKVLHDGALLSTEIYATYAGFSTDGAWAYATKTNKDGVARIKMIHSGIWLIKVSHKKPYPDTRECDQYSYTATLTFQMR